MSYVIRNVRPSILHLPDAGLRLDSGQTAVVETLSPQMEELLANRALEAISSDPDPPVATVLGEDDGAVAAESDEPVSSEPSDTVPSEPSTEAAIMPPVPEKKTRKTATPVIPVEPADDTR